MNNGQENGKLNKQNKEFPKLSSVPKRPKISNKERRDAIAEGLVQDNADIPKYSDEVIPRQDNKDIKKNNVQENPFDLSKNELLSAKISSPVRTKKNEAKDQSQTLTVNTKNLVEQNKMSRILIKPEKSKLQNSRKLGNMPRIPSYNPSAPRVKPVPQLPLVQNDSIVVISGNGVNEIGNYSLTSWSPRSIKNGRSGSFQVATILFANGSSKIKPRDRRILRQVINQFRKVGGKLRVIGHASRRTKTNDPVRHKMSNFWVSTSRAERIANELIRMGVSSNNLRIDAVSDREPRYHEYMPSGEAGNRRAEIFIDF
jgi:flagellar motor protein MotB